MMQEDLVLHFDEETHQYFLGEKKLISVTQLMQKHGLAPNYDAVPSEVLKAKAERGSLIHKEIEDYIKHNQIGFTQEVANFIETTRARNTFYVFSEFRVYNEVAAGTVDLMLKEGKDLIIADIKTTSTLHKEAVSWQLSIYAYLYFLQTTTLVNKAQAYHFDKDGNLNIVDIPLKSMNEVKRLLECEANGELFKQELAVNNADLMQLVEVETLIKNIEEQKKQAEELAQGLRVALMEAMEQNGVTSFENERIKLTYVAPTIRTSIDSAKLKKEMPQVAEQYTKTSNVKASLRITLKEDKGNE